MPRVLAEFMTQDHARLERVLGGALRAGGVDVVGYQAFRGGLLRHIGMEEKILIPALRARRDGEAPVYARRLRVEHAAITSLLVPTPTGEIVAELRGILGGHNALEEGPEGLYADCDALLGDDEEALLSKLLAAPEVRLAAHYDGPNAKRTAREALASAEKVGAYRAG